MIFLPAAGYVWISLNKAGSHGQYWSSVPGSDDNKNSFLFSFRSNYRSAHMRIGFSRGGGLSIRPVQ